MENKFLRSNWNEMRGQNSEWWDDLTVEDLEMIEGNQEQLITVLQERYGYTRNRAIVEVKRHMASYRPKGEGREKRSNKDIRALQYFSDDEDWSEINPHRGFSRAGAKSWVQDFADQYSK